MIVGIVGKANVGKSTFFKALTLADIEIANYPFATIKPNNGIGFVNVDCPETEFGVKCNPREGRCEDGKRLVPVNVIDVAGLVPGAHEGKGLGSQFLNDLNQADVLIHVIDASGGTNAEGEPVPAGSYDPAKDINFLEVELDYWYLSILKKGWDKFIRRYKAEKSEVPRAIEKQMSGVGVDEDMVKDALKNLDLAEDMMKWGEEDMLELARHLRKETKPMVIAANKADKKEARDNIKRLKEEYPDHTIIPMSAESELALKEAEDHGLIKYFPGDEDFEILKDDEMSDKQRQGLKFLESFLKENNGTGVQEALNTAVFDVLGYKAIFPGGVHKLEDSEGNVLPDCFLLPPEATALDFAYHIHTDIGDAFVKAMDVKKKMPVAKDHVLENGDVIEIMTKN